LARHSTGCALAALAPRLLFGVRLAASVCLALYATYYLELPNPFWAATTAAIVCQPNLGAALQKGRFRALGTFIGALVLVSLLALFPQQRIAFLLCLMLWCGLCGAAVVLLRASAAYAAGLAGITAAILFADSIADPSTAFFLGLTRVSEIIIGIMAAAIIMLLTEPGAARLAFADLMERIALQLRAGCLEALARTCATAQMDAARRDVVKALTPLHVAMDAATGETASLYARRGSFRLAAVALAEALVGWRTVSHHPFPQDDATTDLRRELALLLARINPARPERQADARKQARLVLAEIGALRVDSVSARLLVDAVRSVAACLADVVEAVVLLRTGQGDRKRPPVQPLVIADGLPALVAGARAILSMLVVTAFWIATAWPSGPFAVAFAVVSTLIFASFADEARARATDYTLGVAVMVLLGSVIYFYVLPALSTFPALMALLFLLYVPFGMMQVGNWHSALFLAMSISCLPLLGIGNPVAYDPAGYFNMAFAIFAGSAAGTLFFVLLPPPGPEWRAQRLIRLSVRDLRRLMRGCGQPDARRWRALLTRRLESMPPQASPEQHGTLLALLAMGMAIQQLRAAVTDGDAATALTEALAALAAGRTDVALALLETVDRLAGASGEAACLTARAQVAVLSEAVARHAELLAGPARHLTPAFPL
jgi:uncharacterized membrane protein YccC